MSWEREGLGCARRFEAGEAVRAAAGPNIKAVLLGKAPRYAPDRTFKTVHVFLDVELDFKRRSLFGSCTTTVRPFQEGLKELIFDAVDLKVSSVSVNGVPARFEAKNGALTVRPRAALSASDDAEIVVRYRVDQPKAGLHFVYPGPHNPRNPVQAWSQSQPEDARCWYPCHDNPHEKCTSEARITVPAGFRAVSNGRLVETSSSGGKAVWHWRMDRPHSIYLISIAAGRFSEIEERWEDVPVTYYCEKGREDDARRGFRKTVKAMSFFSEITGVPYPYDKYAQVAVAEYPGGMEHTTCTTQTDACLIDARAALDNDLDLLVAHELAHQWFGDLVTCRDWAHAWLNEGFATYFEVLFQEHDKGRDEADYELLMNARAYFDEDARRYRRAIVTQAYKQPWTIFDRHTYEKGGWVLHMLRRQLGDETFRRVVRHYLEKHRDGSVETPDLIEAVADVTGLNLKPFFDQWVYRAGYPILRVGYSWEKGPRKAHLHVVQKQDVSEDNPAFRMSLPVVFIGSGWTKEVRAELCAQEHRFEWTLPGEPLDVRVDPELTLLKKLEVRKPRAMWLRQLRGAERAYARQDAARYVASWINEDSVRALEQAVRREPFWGAGVEMIRALGGMRTEAAYRALGRLLKTRHAKVRRAVVEALGQYKRAGTAALLAPLARRDPSVLVEAEAGRQLGSLGEPRAAALVKANLSKRSYRDVIAAAAVSGIAAGRDPRALETLRRYSLPPHGFLRRVNAIRALADYAAVSDQVVPWICQAAWDPDERVTLAAINSLGQLEDERALATLEKAAKHPNMRLRVYAEEAIARIRAGLDPRPPAATTRARR